MKADGNGYLFAGMNLTATMTKSFSRAQPLGTHTLLRILKYVCAALNIFTVKTAVSSLIVYVVRSITTVLRIL